MELTFICPVINVLNLIKFEQIKCLIMKVLNEWKLSIKKLKVHQKGLLTIVVRARAQDPI